MSILRASISSNILSKADRLFSNDDASVFVELLQNARRAGATLVEVLVEPVGESLTESRITFHDNGRGIDDFQKLLTLGDSDWNPDITAAEDPAGMGFFSLCHSTVEVRSGRKRAVFTQEVFLGDADAAVEATEEEIAGTSITFTRAGSPQALEQTLSRVSEFGPTEVAINGKTLARADFLEGALHREVIDGIEVGLGICFQHGYSWRDENWNFHGARLKHEVASIHGLLIRDPHGHLQQEILKTRFNVLEVGRVKLQLPDRRAIIQEDPLREFGRKVHAAAYRFIATQERHVLSFKSWQDARSLGVALPEASPLLRTWHAATRDDGIDPFFGVVEQQLLADADGVLLVEVDLPNQHTFEAALASEPLSGKRLYQKQADFAGYSWYDSLPVVADTCVTVDGVPFEDWAEQKLPRPSKLSVGITIRQVGHPDLTLERPAFVHVLDGDEVSCHIVRCT